MHRSFEASLRRLRLEVLFIVIFAVFSLVYIATIPPGWNVDEGNHAYRIYQLAAGDLFAEKVITRGTGLKAYGGQVPTNLVGLFDKTGANQPGWVGDPHNHVASNWYKPHSGVYSLKDNGQRMSYNFSGSALYSPVTYMFTLPIVWFAQLIHLSFFWTLILCRLMDAALVGLAFYLVIKYIPIGKWIFFTVGLLPSFIIQATTVGADAPQLAATAVFILLVTRCVYRPQVLRWWHYFLFLGLGVDLTITKLAYAPLILLLFALPVVQPLYRRRRTLLSLIAVAVAALIPSLVWTHLVAYIDTNANPLANYGAQERYIIAQPFIYLRILYYTYFTNQQQPIDNLFGSFIQLPAIYTYVGVTITTLSILVQDRREKLTSVLSATKMRSWRLALWIVFAITALAVSTALYVYTNPLHASSIISIQSRYFLPVLPLILLALYGNVVKNQRVVKSIIVVMSCFLLFGASLMIYHRLYQTVPPGPHLLSSRRVQ